MPPSEPTRTAIRDAPSRASSEPFALAVYGCDQEEAGRFRKLAPTFGVTLKIISEPLTGTTVDLARGHHCISIGHKTTVTPSTLTALGRLGVKYISTRSIGANHIDADYARRVGITVGTVAYSPDSVADYTLLLILMAIRHIKPLIRRADAQDYRLIGPPGQELRDLTIGVVGTGRIGTAVIERLHGFGGRTLTYDIGPRPRPDHVELDELLRSCDIVTLHTPLTADTHHLLDRRRIAHLKRGAYVVNTGRGALIDTDALLHALQSGQLAGAALDVVEGEEGVFYADCRDKPIGGSTLVRLQGLPNVVITPHTAYYTDHALDDIVRETMINCLTFEEGEQRWTD
ncbi:MAG: lactate dehydrogenase [Microlunatus sp.]|nr:lactate dehydrogenase [Microlunatus sp.]